MSFSVKPQDFYDVNFAATDSAVAKATALIRVEVDERLVAAMKAAREVQNGIDDLYVKIDDLKMPFRLKEHIATLAAKNVVDELISAGFNAHTTKLGRDDDEIAIYISFPPADPTRVPRLLTATEERLLDHIKQFSDLAADLNLVGVHASVQNQFTKLRVEAGAIITQLDPAYVGD